MDDSKWREKINEITAPYILPAKKVYIVPKEVWEECKQLYEETMPEHPGMKYSIFATLTVPITTMSHPNNHYPILVLSKYLFIDLGI